MTCLTPAHERHGVIVQYPFGPYHEAQFLDDPGEIEALTLAGEAWRVMDAVLLEPAT